MGDLGLLKNLNTELLRRIVVTVEMSWILFSVIIYYQFSQLFFIYLPLLLVVNLLTMLPLPSVFKKLRKEAQEDLLHFSGVTEQEEGLADIDLWDRVSVGFYIVLNTVLFFVLLMVLFF